MNCLYSLTPEDQEWGIALKLASWLHLGKASDTFFCLPQPSSKFLQGLHNQGYWVYRVTPNHAALHEYAKSLGSWYTPPEEIAVRYTIYFSGQPPETPVMTSGPVNQYDRL